MDLLLPYVWCRSHPEQPRDLYLHKGEKQPCDVSKRHDCVSIRGLRGAFNNGTVLDSLLISYQL